MPDIDAETRFDRALAEAGLTDQREALRARVLPALALIEAGADKIKDPPGRSRIGGGPDLPAGVEWPRDDSGRQLNFLAQIALTDLPAGPLPRQGLLSFFIGAEFADGRVLYNPDVSTLTRHRLPGDAEATARTAAAMLGWNAELNRMTVETPQAEGLTATTEADGRARFYRDGQPVLALASEYEINDRPQRLSVVPILTLPGDDPAAYDLQEAARIGDGPQHQMFGHAGATSSGQRSPAGRAAAHAQASGWDDLSDPDDWFVLLALRSGGGFNFNDRDTVIYVVHQREIAPADLSRVFAYIDQD